MKVERFDDRTRARYVYYAIADDDRREYVTVSCESWHDEFVDRDFVNYEFHVRWGKREEGSLSPGERMAARALVLSDAKARFRTGTQEETNPEKEEE